MSTDWKQTARFTNYRLLIRSYYATWVRNVLLATRVGIAFEVARRQQIIPFHQWIGTAIVAASFFLLITLTISFIYENFQLKRIEDNYYSNAHHPRSKEPMLTMVVLSTIVSVFCIALADAVFDTMLPGCSLGELRDVCKASI